MYNYILYAFGEGLHSRIILQFMEIDSITELLKCRFHMLYAAALSDFIRIIVELIF